MSLKVKETANAVQTNKIIQAYNSKGYNLVSSKNNRKGGSILTFKKSSVGKKKQVDGVRLASRIVGLVELICCAVTLALMFLLVIQGCLFKNTEFCQRLLEEWQKAKQPGETLPTIAQLNNIGSVFLLVGSIVGGLCAVTLIPTIWTVAKVKKTESKNKLCAFAVIGIICLFAIPNSVLLLVVRSKINANPKANK